MNRYEGIGTDSQSIVAGLVLSIEHIRLIIFKMNSYLQYTKNHYLILGSYIYFLCSFY